MIKAALGRKAIDAPAPSGRWSPLITLAPLAVGVALADDMIMLLLSLVAVLGAQLCSEWSNSVYWYQYLRPALCVCVRGSSPRTPPCEVPRRLQSCLEGPVLPHVCACAHISVELLV